jgi:hypothetical protein
MGDNIEVLIARMDERLKTLEARAKTLEGRLWAAVLAIVAYVGSQLLGLLQITGVG